MHDEEKKRIWKSVFMPALFVAILWIIKGTDAVFQLDLNRFGLQPMHVSGLPGILTCPLLHADFSHLFANSIPLFVLGSLLFYFYRPLAWKTLILIYLLTGIWVWLFARGSAVHIGASGVVYGLASFLILSGIIRREKGLMVITLLVTFLYGSFVWGVFPELFPHQPISWESHLMGIISGVILSVWFRNEGPQRQTWEWEEEEEDESEEPAQEQNHDHDGSPGILLDNPQVDDHSPEK